MEDFKKELEILINKHCIENQWDMPDYLMAEVITSFILSSGEFMKRNLDWHGVDSICHPELKENQDE